MSIMLILWLLFAGYLLVNAALLHRRLHELVHRKLSQWGLERLVKRVDALFESVAMYRGKLVTMTATVVLSSLIQLIGFMSVFFIGLAIDAPASLEHYLVFLPVIAVVTALPVSIGGLGVRESTLVAFFVPVGLTREQSVTIGLLMHAAMVIASLPGGWIYLTYRRNQAIPKLSGTLLEANEP